jgi:hypothetical protein
MMLKHINENTILKRLIIYLYNNKNIDIMKKLLILVFCLSLFSCGTTDVQGNPAAIQMGASIGGAIGSVLGDSMDSHHDGFGWSIGNMIGTIAGAAIGNAATSPKVDRNNDGDDYSYSRNNQINSREYQEQEQNSVSNTLPIYIEKIRFVDENHNHVIDSRETCKLVFELYNNSSATISDIYPRITLSNDRVGVSDPAIIDKIEGGQRIRYTANLYGYSNLRNGSVTITIAACQQNGPVGDVRQFSLDTQQ